MSNKSVSTMTKMYFEGVLYFAGWTMIIISFPILFSLWWVGLIVGLLGLIIATTHYRLTVDTSNKTVLDFLWFLGLKSNLEKFSYSELHYILLKKSKFKQQLNHQSLSNTISGIQYTAYLICDDKKHYLGESQNFSELQSKMVNISKQLKTEIKYPAD
jgi:hypothetical protein